MGYDEVLPTLPTLPTLVLQPMSAVVRGEEVRNPVVRAVMDATKHEAVLATTNPVSGENSVRKLYNMPWRSSKDYADLLLPTPTSWRRDSSNNYLHSSEHAATFTDEGASDAME